MSGDDEKAVMYGGSGADTLLGDDVSDDLCGGSKNDSVFWVLAEHDERHGDERDDTLKVGGNNCTGDALAMMS